MRKIALFTDDSMKIMKPIYHVTIKYNDELGFCKKHVTGQR